MNLPGTDKESLCVKTDYEILGCISGLHEKPNYHRLSSIVIFSEQVSTCFVGISYFYTLVSAIMFLPCIKCGMDLIY